MIRRLFDAPTTALWVFVLCLATCVWPDPSRAQDTYAVQDTMRTTSLSLEPARQIAFETNEGTWMSLDVSPDGRHIVFDLLGDLYTLPIEGGTATRITGGMAFDSQPRYSPDGSKIAFVSDRSGSENLWYLTSDLADTVQVTREKDGLFQSPEWTPDGQYLLATSGSGLGPGNVWMYHLDGGKGIQLIKQPNLKTTGAAFGPNPRYFWYAERSGSWNYNANLPEYQLSIYDRDTGERYPQTFVYGSAFRPTLSPDGKWLVYGTRHDTQTGLRIRDLQAGTEKWLAYPVQRDDQESIATRDVYPGMSFTPDSRSLVTSYGGKIWRIPVDGGAASEIPFTVSVELDLGPELDFDYPISDDPTFVVKQIRGAVPSPDGSRLAFTALDRLWVMDFPNGSPRRVTGMEVGEHHPSWSPDGSWIAYVTWDVGGGHVYRARASGSGTPERLTRVAAYYESPAWSPDGNRIALIRSSANGFLQEVGAPFSPGPGTELVWLPASGGDLTLIAPTEGRGHPHFVSDKPDRVYFYSGGSGLLSMRWDGTDLKTHLRVAQPPTEGSTFAPSSSLVLMAPRGDHAIAEVGNDYYLVTVPYAGGETPILVLDPEKGALPFRKLTVVGGQFPAWSADGAKVHWSIGNAHFVYDIAAARAFEDSVRAASSGLSPAARKNLPRYEAAEYRVTLQANRDTPQGAVVLRGARAITMRGDEIIARSDVVIQNNRITAVGATGQVAVPPGAQIIDMAGKTIIPGFVDTHAHIWPSWGIHKTQVWEYLANLAYGVTTTRDPQTATTDVLSYSDLVESGALVGPRVYYTGPGVFSRERIKSLEHARRILKRYSEYYDSKTIKQYLAGNRQQRQWVIQAAREQRLMPTTEGALDLELDLTQIIDGYPGHEHSFPIFPLYKDIIEFVAQSRSTYTPTLLVSYGGPFAENYYYATENVHGNSKLRRFTPHYEIDRKTRRRGANPGEGGWFMREEYVFDKHARFVADLVAAGGRAGVGSHGQLQGLGYHWELWSMQSGGLSEHDALRVATLHGAQALGLDQDLGTIEPGKLADLIVFDADPLADIRNTDTIRFVMMNGRLFESDTMNEVWPRSRALEKQWWWEGDPVDLPGVRK